jgi:acyl carrier protein
MVMISVNEFTEKLEAEFEDLQKGTLTPDTDYRTIKGWSSMHALIVIAFVDANFDVLLSGSDLKNTITIKDLYNLIQHKK